MRGYRNTWARSCSAESRGECTSLRVKNPLVHSSSRRTVHGATSVIWRDCKDLGKKENMSLGPTACGWVKRADTSKYRLDNPLRQPIMVANHEQSDRSSARRVRRSWSNRADLPRFWHPSGSPPLI